MAISFEKPHATALQRIAHLRAKGLVISQPNVAAQKIEQIGYERLRLYFLSRRHLDRPGKPFRPGTTYRDILRLHECDSILRRLCFFEGIDRFELLFRNKMSERLSARFGSHPYFHAAAFAGAARHNQALQRMIQVFEDRKSKDARARHYSETYDGPSLPPIWLMKEFMTFGTAARVYGCLSNTIRSEIARDFGVPSLDVFNSWVPCFVDLRNRCAHHDRLFNHRFQKQPQRIRRADIPVAASQTLKAYLECLDYALEHASSSAGLVDKVRKVIERYPEIQPDEAGY